MRQLIEFICNELEYDRPVACAVIVSSTGSTPRGTGSRMAMAEDCRCQGTVGGGPAEAMARRTAARVLQAKTSRLLLLDLTGKDAAAEGMICGGRLEILVEYIAPLPENKNIFKELAQGYNSGQGSVLYTIFRQTGDLAEVMLRTTDLKLLPEGLGGKVCSRAAKTRLPFAEIQNETIVLVEPVRPLGHVIIAGAGHVGRATANIAALAGFGITVIDDRPEFLDPADFSPACRIRRITAFDNCFKEIYTGPESMIVIVTRGHIHDQTVLAQALKTRAGYVGMIGSRKKRDAIYENLRGQGAALEKLARVHSPIGLPIGADTPEEIAISIVAELIRERAKG